MKIGTHLRIVSPTIYNIETPEELAKRPGLTNIAKWGWVRLNELLTACLEVHQQTVAIHELEKVSEPIGWAVETSSLPLIQDFGPLMGVNGCDYKERYNFVLCGNEAPPTVEAFHLRSTTLPTTEDCRFGRVFVPAGWASEVIDLIKNRGIYQVSIKEGATQAHPTYLIGKCFLDGSNRVIRMVE